MTWKYEGYAYLRPHKNRLMDNFISLAHVPQAQFAGISVCGKMHFFVAGAVAAIQRIPVGLPQRKGRQSEFNRQLRVTGKSS